MNVIEKANEVSIFTRWTQNVAQTTTPWEYGMSKNVPPHTRHYTEDRPVDFEPSRTMTWTIPRLGLLKKVVLKVDSTFAKSRFWFFSAKVVSGESDITLVTDVAQATHVFIAPEGRERIEYTGQHDDDPLGRVAAFKKAFNQRLLDVYKAAEPNKILNPYKAFTGAAGSETASAQVVGGDILAAAMADPKFPCFAVSGSVDTGFFFRKPGGIAHMFSMYEIRARNREIARLYPENIEYEAYSERKYPIESRAEGAYSTTGVNNVKPIPAMAGDNLMSYFKLGAAGDYVLTEYIEPRFSYFTKLKQAFLTSFCEDLTLTLTATSLAAMNSLYPLYGYAGSQKVVVTPTWHWINPRPEDLARLRQAMTAAPQGIPRLQASTMFEGGAQTTFSNDQISLTMNVPYPVTRTIFSLDVNENGLPSLKRGDNRLSISSVALEASGVEVFKWTADQLHDHMSNGSYVNSAWQDRLYCINWSSLGDNTEQGGFLPARNLYNVQLKITTTKDTIHATTGKKRTTIYPDTKTIGRVSTATSESMIYEAKRLIDGSNYWSEVSAAGNTNPDYVATKQLIIPYSGLVRETGLYPLERTQVMVNTAVEAKDVELKVFHEYYTIESTIPSNGQVNVTAFD